MLVFCQCDCCIILYEQDTNIVHEYASPDHNGSCTMVVLIVGKNVSNCDIDCLS